MATSPLTKIKLDNVQRKIIYDFADILTQEVNLSKTVIKGFLWKSLREWQNLHGMSIIDTERGSGSSPEERVKQAKQILNIFKDHINEFSDVDSKSVESGISKALRHYLFHYANR